MKKLKKIFKVVNDFTFDVLIVITLIWGINLAVALTIEVPVLGIPILAIGVFVAILMRKRKSEIEK